MSKHSPVSIKDKLTAAMRHKIAISFSIPMWSVYLVLFLLAFGAYIRWEYYWFSEIGLYFIKWHTHIVATAIIFSFIPVLGALVYFIKPAYLRVLGISVSVWAGLVLMEVLLVLTGFTKTYIESRHGYYKSPFDYDTNNAYHIYIGRSTVTEDCPEFSYTYRVNSLGYTGKEWTKQADTGTYRIITMGDSFTEGVGAPADSTYPELLQAILTAKGQKVEVLNAGVGGSDPIFSYKNMSERLLPYKPNLVVQTISENDILNDFGIRGGFERFKTDSTLQRPEQSKLEIIYAISYTARVFLDLAGYNYSAPYCMNEQSDCLAEKNVILKDVITRYSMLAEANGFNVLLVFYPTKYEGSDGEYYLDFAAAKKLVAEQKAIAEYDLMPCYVGAFKNSSGYEAFYWNHDGHHNAAGYRLMAQCIADGILQKGLLTDTSASK